MTSTWPKGWSRHRLKFSSNINSHSLPETTDEDYSFDYVDISRVSQGRISDEPQLTVFGNAPSRARRLAKSGDTIVSTVRTYLRAVAEVVPSEEPRVYSTGFAVVEPDTRRVHPRFLTYYLQSAHFVERVVADSVGVSYPAINAADLAAYDFWAPTTDDQRTIADFLDRETAQIDAMIEAQAVLLAGIDERLSALSEASVFPVGLTVTDGQDGAWMGYVPQHWRISSLASACSLIQTGPFGSQLKADEYEDAGVAVINPADIASRVIDVEGAKKVAEATASRLSRHAMRQGDVVTARRGEMGRSAVVRGGAVGSLCGTGSLLVRPRTDVVNPDFLVLLLGARKTREALSDLSVGSTMDNLNSKILGRFRVPVPPLDEQERIVRDLSTATERTELVRRAGAEVTSLMRERREALITAAVTGRIDPVTGTDCIEEGAA